MKLIRFILARFVYKVPFQKRVWYNHAAMIKSKEWDEFNLIMCFDDNGSYINCPKIGGEVIYRIQGVDYIYKVVGFDNDNQSSDWLYSSDYINPIIQFVRKKK